MYLGRSKFPKMKTMLMMSAISMTWWRNHILMMLMSLEFLLLSALITIINSAPINMTFILLLFLALSVTLACLGLSMLVNMSRTHHSSMSTPLMN